jgi:hypothetical protein
VGLQADVGRCVAIAVVVPAHHLQQTNKQTNKHCHEPRVQGV